MKIEHVPQIGITSISCMKPGQWGVTAGGKYYLRTIDSATCLNDVGSSYSGNANRVDDVLVIIMPPGTVITIVI